jgi:LPS sulfotransferase NodH
LCGLLADTGLAGNPDSFFRCESFLWWANYLNISVSDWKTEYEFDQAYLSTVKEYGSNRTPIFGMRLMWESVADLSIRLEKFYPGLSSDCARFKSAFGRPLYLHLSRENKVAQAISRLRAEQTGLWHKFSDGTERERLKSGREPAYDARVLSRLLATLEKHDAAWSTWFTQQNLEPLCITYETLSSEPQVVLASVLCALDLDPTIAESVRPRSAKMADSKSQEWATRFRIDKDHM